MILKYDIFFKMVPVFFIIAVLVWANFEVLPTSKARSKQNWFQWSGPPPGEFRGKKRFLKRLIFFKKKVKKSFFSLMIKPLKYADRLKGTLVIRVSDMEPKF